MHIATRSVIIVRHDSSIFYFHHVINKMGRPYQEFQLIILLRKGVRKIVQNVINVLVRYQDL